MRKLILIAVFATMSSSVCHANLSLASNEPAQQPVQQAALEAKAEMKVEAAVTTVKPLKVSRPRHQSVRVYGFRRSYGHCL
jgi:hypothetical protein